MRLPNSYSDVLLSVFKTLETPSGVQLDYSPTVGAEALFTRFSTDARVAAYVCADDIQLKVDDPRPKFFYTLVQEVDVPKMEDHPILDERRMPTLHAMFSEIKAAIRDAEIPCDVLHGTKSGGARLYKFFREPITDAQEYERKSEALRQRLVSEVYPRLPFETKADEGSSQWERRWLAPFAKYNWRDYCDTYACDIAYVGDGEPGAWEDMPEVAYERKTASASAARVVSRPRRSFLSLPERLKRLEDALKEIKSISGSGGHDQCFRAACTCAYWIPEDPEAAMRMLEWWNSFNAEPPWDSKDLEHKLADAFAKE